ARALPTARVFPYTTLFRSVNAEWQVLQFRGDTSPYLKPPTGRASFNVLKMAREGLFLPLRAALNKAKQANRTVRRENMRVNQNRSEEHTSELQSRVDLVCR